jgi:hypothetical protein
MHLRAGLLTLALTGLVPSSVALAADLFVDRSNGSDSADGLAWATARATVSSALATAGATPEPDVISVAMGTYNEWVVVPADVTLLGGFPRGGGAREPARFPTVLDGRRAFAPVVHFPPGSDRSVLDGFVVRGGWTVRLRDGGGVWVENSEAVVRDCIIEGNNSCAGSGIYVYSTRPGAVARIEGNVIRGNTGTCTSGTGSRGGGVLVWSPSDPDLGAILSRNRIERNEAGVGSGISLYGQARIENLVVRDNADYAVALRGPRIEVVNVVVSGTPWPMSVRGSGSLFLTNLTSTEGLDVGEYPAGAAVDVVIENSILLRGSGGYALQWSGTGPSPTVSSSIVEGGWPEGTDILDADPLFAAGPEGGHYLSQVAAGQATTSPAVDAGNRPAAELGLDRRTTATTSLPDAGAVDLGYHAASITAFRILRGTIADALAVHATVPALPFADDAGTLSDPLLPLLFYRAPELGVDLVVGKDLASDAVTLDHRRR